MDMASIIPTFLYFALTALYWAIIARVLVSWLPMLGVQIDPYNPVIKFLHDITDPILDPIKRFTTVGMIDFSPIVAIVVLGFITRAIQSAFHLPF